MLFVDGLTKSTILEVLEDADKFATDALTAYVHKVEILDSGEGRFKEGQSFMRAVFELQTKLRIVAERLEKK